MIRELVHDFAKWLDKKSYQQPKPEIEYENPKVEFYSSVEGIEKWSPILPASKAIPDWYKRLPAIYENTVEDRKSTAYASRIGELPSGTPIEWGTKNHTIKTCPGMQDIMTTGYVNTFWGHALIEVAHDGCGLGFVSSSDFAGYANHDDTTKVGSNADYVKLYKAQEAEIFAYLKGRGYTEDELVDWTKTFRDRSLVQFSTHEHQQYSTMTDQFPEEWSKVLLKLHNPWRIRTPKGYSTIITDPVYHYHPVLQTLTGVIDTDYYHMFNAFFYVKQKGIKFELKFGTPIAHYMIVKRTDFPYELRSSTEADLAHERQLTNLLNTDWGSSRPYRKGKDIFLKERKCPFGG